MFGQLHIIALSLSIAAIILLSVLLRNAKLKTWYRILLYTGIVSETIKILYYTVQNESVYGGYLPKTDLPFQLCSIQLIFIMILNFSSNEKLHRLLLGFMLPTCLIGGLAAMAIPTSSSLSGSILTLQYFGYHAMIVAFAIYLFHCGEIKWTARDYANTLKLLGLMGFIAIYINSMVYDLVSYSKIDGTEVVEFGRRVNFMYVIDPPADGLPLLNKDHGWLVYFAHFASIAVIAVTLCYIKPIVCGIFGKKHAGTADDAEKA